MNACRFRRSVQASTSTSNRGYRIPKRPVHTSYLPNNVTTQPLGSILETKPLRQGQKTRILGRESQSCSHLIYIVSRLQLPLASAVTNSSLLVQVHLDAFCESVLITNPKNSISFKFPVKIAFRWFSMKLVLPQALAGVLRVFFSCFGGN